jgi:signal transduction histidine kinase
LEDAPFWEAFESLIKNAAVGTPLRTEFKVRGEMRELPRLDQQNLLHIGQEALTNTLKYAHATRFETRLSFNAKEIRLELEDDGNGFRTNGRHDGFGLIGMGERVAQLSGSLRIASARGKGTKIVVVIPEQSTSP